MTRAIRERRHCVVLALAGISMLASLGQFSTPAEAKIPGAVHCYNDICHRVRTVEETAARRGLVEPVLASYYDAPDKDRFNPSFETSSGTLFEPNADDNAASPIHPDGTILLVWSPVSRGAAIVRVNNAGPYYPGRTLDLSYGVAAKLGYSNKGVMPLLTVVIWAPTEPDAHYVRGRVYPKVHGYLGKFDNIALASFAEPQAREALFMGNAPLPPLVFASPEQILLKAADEQARLNELARQFQLAPTEMMPPPPFDQASSSFGSEPWGSKAEAQFPVLSPAPSSPMNGPDILDMPTLTAAGPIRHAAAN